jgi:hypothetical protein
MTGFFLLHGLFVVGSGALIPVCIVAWALGTCYAALARIVHERFDIRGLAIVTALPMAGLLVLAIASGDWQAGALLTGPGLGFCAAGAVIRARAPVKEVPVVGRRSLVEPLEPNPLLEAALAGGAFAVTAVGLMGLLFLVTA